MKDMTRAVWRKSTRSNNSADCVEVADTPDTVGVRDSKNPGGPILVFTREQWRAFVEAVKDGEFDRRVT